VCPDTTAVSPRSSGRSPMSSAPAWRELCRFRSCQIAPARCVVLSRIVVALCRGRRTFCLSPSPGGPARMWICTPPLGSAHRRPWPMTSTTLRSRCSPLREESKATAKLYAQGTEHEVWHHFHLILHSQLHQGLRTVSPRPDNVESTADELLHELECDIALPVN
jgi:hypothetical protein